MSITPPEPVFPSGLVLPGNLEGENHGLALYQQNQNGSGSFPQELNGALHFLLRDIEGNQSFDCERNIAKATPEISFTGSTGSEDTSRVTAGGGFEAPPALNSNPADEQLRRESKLWQNYQRRDTVYKDT